MKKLLYVFSLLRHKFKIILSFFMSRKKKRIIIVATPTHGNLGDQAIVYAEKKVIKQICPTHSVIEIENGAFLRCKNFLKKFVRATDVIIIDGGGNLGTLWSWEDDKITDIISTFSQNKIVVFPQTVFYEPSDTANERIEKNNNVYSQARDLTILLRDKASLDFFVRTFPNIKVKLCPDIVLSLNQFFNLKRNGILICLRSDRETSVDSKEKERFLNCLTEKKAKISSTDTVIRKTVIQYNRKRELRKKWKEFSAAELIITDRLHAMIFSYITGTPCIAINNSSKKVEGTFQFISKCNFIKMANNLTEAVEIIPMLMDIENCNLNEFVYPISILEEVLKNGAPK